MCDHVDPVPVVWWAVYIESGWYHKPKSSTYTIMRGHVCPGLRLLWCVSVEVSHGMASENSIHTREITPKYHCS